MLRFMVWNIFKQSAQCVYLVGYIDFVLIDKEYILVGFRYTYNRLILSTILLLKNQLYDISVPHVCITSYIHVNEI